VTFFLRAKALFELFISRVESTYSFIHDFNVKFYPTEATLTGSVQAGLSR
jgi:hypothetical protein